MPPVAWAEEFKNGLGFETGSSYDNNLTTFQYVTDGDGQSSCTASYR